jgi:uncharacterized membrane protein YphA (DoxX/SURF4 family)
LTTITTDAATETKAMSEPRAERFLRWWLDDFRPVDDALRIAFYGGQLAMQVLGDVSIFAQMRALTKTHPSLYVQKNDFYSTGLPGFLELPYPSPAFVEGLVVVTVVAWVATIVGFRTRVAAIATALGFALMHAYSRGIDGITHHNHFALYAMLALCFARMTGPLSVDGYLARRRGKSTSDVREADVGSSVLDTGFARKLLLVIIAGGLFSAGLSKLLNNGGLGWLDGRTLQFWIRFQSQRVIWPGLNVFVSDRLWLCAVLSTFTVVFELIAPIMVFSRRSRAPYLVLALSFHVGIMLVMGINFFYQACCYILIVNWERRASAPARAPKPRDRDRGPVFAALAATGLAVVLTIVSVFKIQWWPVTSFPMFSYVMSESVVTGYSKTEMRDPANVQRALRDPSFSGSFWKMRDFFLGRIRVRLSGDGVEQMFTGPKNVSGDPAAIIRGFTLSRALTLATVADLRAKPDGEIGPRPDSPAAKFLRGYAEVMKAQVPDHDKYRRIELVVLFDGVTPTPIASEPF